jgi:hypothetical protein
MIEPQLVKFFHKEETKRKPGYIGLIYACRQKKDGVYGFLEIEDGEIDGPFTKKGNKLKGLEYQIQQNKEELELAIAKSMIKRGRLVFEIRDWLDKEDFYTVNGLTKRHKNQQMRFFIHDILDWDIPNEKGWERENSLFMLQDSLPEGFEVLPVLYEGKDIDKMLELYREGVQKGWEGIVMKCMSTEYRPGARDYSLMKMKAEKKIPGCKLIRHVPGEGNGAILVEHSGVEFPVAGIDDNLYKDLIKGRSQKLFDIVCMSVNKSGKPREPRLCK